MQLLEERRVDDKRRGLSAIGSNMAFEVERTLDRSLASTYALATAIRERESVVRDNFDSIAANMIETYGGIDNLQLAPGGVVSQIYPLEGNEAAIGHDLLNDPARRVEALAAIESRKLTLAGPFTLIQGGVAVIGRLPVFIPRDSGEDRFWGFSIALIRMQTLLDTAMLSRTAGKGHDFELSRVHPDTGQPDTFFRSSDRDLPDEMTFAVAVPNGNWILHLETDLGRPPWLLAAEVVPVILIAALVAIALYIYLLRTTERSRAGDALREAEDRFRQMAENVREVLFLVDFNNYNVLYVNSAYEEIWGRTRESLYEQPTSWLDAIHQKDRDRVYAALEAQQITGEFNEEFRLIRPDGSVHWVLDHVYQIRNEVGEIYRLVGTAEDTTERKAAQEAELRWTEETSVMAEIGRTVSASLDINEIYQSLGEEIRKLIPFDRFSMSLVDHEKERTLPTWELGMEIPGVHPGDEVPWVGGLGAEAIRTKSPIMLEAETEADLEHGFPLLVTGFRAGLRSFLAVPLLVRDTVIGVLRLGSKNRGIYTQRDLELLERMGNQITGAISNAQLYADLKRAEEALRSSEEQTRASLDEKKVLLKEINHRVKNNLQIISSLLNLQSRDIQGEQALRSFQVSQDRIRAMALVHEKLYVSEDLVRIDFGAYIKSLVTELGSSYGLGLRDIDLKIDVENVLLGVDIAIPCGVIVNELVTNSLKHAFPGDRSGEITISFRQVDGQYTMIFKDDGVGLPEELDISRPSSLGLTIVNALTGQLGGTIDLRRNGGAEVRITFPAK